MATVQCGMGVMKPAGGWRAMSWAVAVMIVVISGATTLAPGAQRGAARALFIELETGNVGCGDRLLAVPILVEVGEDPLRVALDAVLTRGTELAREHGLYNGLGASDLAIEELEVMAGRAKVYLTGTLSLNGECDAPRVREQLQRTAKQFREIRAVEFFVDGVPLEDLLPGR